MPASTFDPSPRTYPPGVFAIRRSTRGPAVAPPGTDVEAIESWLLHEALREDDMLPLVESLWWRMAAAGLNLDRASLHVGTLHPQLFGFGWNWERADGICDEVRVTEEARSGPSYTRTPLFQAIEHGETFRGGTADPEVATRYPFMAELAQRGFTAYVAMPLSSGGRYHNAATMATRMPGGFRAADLAAVQRLLRVFALHVERHIVLRIARNTLDTYLGATAGGRVLSGSIKRGDGEALRAVVWVSDLRGFTDLTDRLPAPDVIALLNAYFECLTEAVVGRGGQVLKFIGDGLLAVFPFADDPDQDAAIAGTALDAAEAAL
ncbi:MAG: adenylate/guanylate cyclase domain-containing protein, partial [Casimicrobiaceae bacterium]